jgi:hypothetical protein
VEGNTTEFVVEAVSGSGSAWRRGTGVGGVQQEEGKDKEEEEEEVVLEEAVEVEVRCLKLNREKNERLRWVALHGEAEMTEQERGDAGFMLALRGPMSLGEWMAWRRERGLGVTTMVSGWSVVGV